MTTQPIDVRDQRPLGLGRTFSLCLKGIKHRLFRSFLTFAVIVLAVSFFMYLLGSSINARAVHDGVRLETSVVRRAALALELWFGTPTSVVMGHRLSEADHAGRSRIQSVTGLPVERISAIAEIARDEDRLVSFFDNLDAGTRAALVKKSKRREVIEWLADATHWDSFTRTLAQLKSLRLPLSLVRVQELVAARVSTAEEINAVTSAWNRTGEQIRVAVSAVAGTEPATGWQEWFASADAASVAKLTGILAEHGFAADYPLEMVVQIQADVRALRLRDRVAADLNDDNVRAAWKKAFIANPTLDEKLLLLDDVKVVSILSDKYSLAELSQISQAIAHERRLVALERSLAGKVPADDEFIGGRQLFLVVISFVVCMVGIANAMLMAITERFREIATMKCLGATDGFILTQFLMEAAMQGAAGGVLGMLIGFLLALSSDGAVYGGHLFVYFPVIGLLVCAGMCILAGLLLATLASIYPSWMASRMAPMDAMRVE